LAVYRLIEDGELRVSKMRGALRVEPAGPRALRTKSCQRPATVRCADLRAKGLALDDRGRMSLNELSDPEPRRTGVNDARSGPIRVRNGSRVTVIAPPKLLSGGDGATYVEMFDKRTLARYFRVSVDTIDRLVKAGKLPAVRIGNQVRFTLDDVNAFIERHRSPEEAA
jgi:excisionase family DNA binding protein